MNAEDNHLLQTMKAVLVPIHPAGYPFIGLFAAATLFLAVFSEALGVLGLIATAWCVYFFRNPERVTPVREGLVVSPADGMVQRITRAVPPPEIQLGSDERTRISIFLNVFDVHVNRIPLGGTVAKLHYFPGRFLNASLDKASEENERQLIKISMPDGNAIGVVQIAGLVARRIICELKEEQQVKAGEVFGLIRFGSRVDVYLPPSAKALVVEGQRAIGGETVLADLQSDEPARIGTRH